MKEKPSKYTDNNGVATKKSPTQTYRAHPRSGGRAVSAAWIQHQASITRHLLPVTIRPYTMGLTMARYLL